MKTTDIRERLLDRIPDQWGKWVSCDSGWDWILDDLDRKLSYLDPEYQLNQVKEKFGTLRFYYQAQAAKDVVSELMDDAVRTAEHYSAYTCEICGGCSVYGSASKGIVFDSTAGLKVSGGWFRTLCDSCADIAGYVAVRSVDD
jgi:hypothetical protein